MIDPRPFAVGSIKKTFEKYTHLEKLLPAMGYGKTQITELAETINRSPLSWLSRNPDRPAPGDELINRRSG